MRYLMILLLLLASCAASANPSDSACQRLMDVLNNLANRTLSNAEATVASDALNHVSTGLDPSLTQAQRCAVSLTYLHGIVKDAVKAKKRFDAPPPDSSEVD